MSASMLNYNVYSVCETKVGERICGNGRVGMLVALLPCLQPHEVTAQET